MASPTGRPIRSELLDAAEVQLRRVGPNGFSYGDLAGELGIKAPSIHHHFRSKDDLVAEVVARYRQRFADRVATIDGDDARSRLLAFADLFTGSARNGLACLCGTMSTDWLTIGDRSRESVAGFFLDQQRWLEDRITEGVDGGEFVTDLDVAATADLMLAGLEGALLLSRSGRPARLVTDVMTTTLDRIATSPQPTTNVG